MRFCAVSSRAVLVFVETHGLTPDPLIVETLERILEDHCGASVVNDAEQGVWPHELWEQLEVAGLPLTWVPEECSGAGATLIDGFEVAKVAGRYAVPVPLVETLLAGWLLSKAGLKVPPGALAPVHAADFIDVQPSHTLSGVAQRVAFASKAAYLVVETSSGVGLVERDAVEIHSRVGLSGDPYDRVSFDQTPVNAWSADTDLQRSVKLMGATLRSQQIAGALERILAQSTQYAGERVAFGRPIAKFQAVQHNLAVLAGEMATAGAAASAAARVLARYGAQDDRSLLAVASAKVRAGESAGSGAAIAHQVHGAIGYTRDYSLQQYTRRLLSWRDDFGSENFWARELGTYVAQRGAEALWPALTSF